MNLYFFLKSLHLIAVISWMAGLLYLPRIFVYHVENYEKKEATEIFKIMEKKLYFYIMFPAMILSWIFGLILISLIDFSSLAFLWLQLKLILVLLLSFYHFYLGSCLKDLNINKNTKSSNFFRIINEIPTILLVIIIFVVIYKPL
jgi:putative membrane protein